MKITSIKAQVNRQGRYSIFVEGKYAFSLSDTALLESKLVNGQEISQKRLGELKELSDQDKLLSQTINYAMLRPHSRWEIEQYLKKKKCPTALSEIILNKLSKLGYIDDQKFAEAWVESRLLSKPTSLRKLEQKLKLKHVSSEVIQITLAQGVDISEKESIRQLAQAKIKQKRYQDKLKLMQFLSRQGFNYGDIKEVVEELDI